MNQPEIIFYQSEDNFIQLEVKLDDIQEFHDFIRDNIDKITSALDGKNNL